MPRLNVPSSSGRPGGHGRNAPGADAGNTHLAMAEGPVGMAGHTPGGRPQRVLWRPMSTFADLGLSGPALRSLAHLGYERPTPIQEQAIPPLLEGRDVIGQAQTGTGKTAAFGLPMIEYADPSDPSVQALVLTPTRELCIQVTQALRAYGEHRDVDVVATFGGAPIRTQQAQLRDGGHI